jgi:positive regulator of sigma E activity
MTDDVVVISSDNGMARVKVTAKAACCDCSARAICLGENNPEQILMVLNPLKAKPGDTVTIEIPDDTYTKTITRMFGVLLIAGLTGFGSGTLIAAMLHMPESEFGLPGFLLGIFAGGIYIYHDFQVPGKKKLYPVITAIHPLVNKGE